MRAADTEYMSKSVLVTGANRGLGLEFTRQLLAEGATVYAGCRQPESAEALSSLEGALHILALDVTDDASIAAAVETVTAAGGLDWLINNAGIGVMTSLENLTREEMRDAFEVNTISPLMVSKAFAPLLADSKAPLIAIVTSLIGSISHKDQLFKGGYPYSSSKAAANMVVKYLSLDLKEQGIATAAISPGWVQTDMGGSEAPLLPPESIAGMLKVLDQVTLSNTGQYWHYDGSPLTW